MASKTSKNYSRGSKGKRSTGSSAKNAKSRSKQASSSVLAEEIFLFIMLGISVLLFLGVLGILGKFSEYVGGVLIGLFGMVAYLFPFAFLFAGSFCILNKWKRVTKVKVTSTFVLLIALSCLAQLIFATDANTGGKLVDFYTKSAKNGGLIGGVLTLYSCRFLTQAGSYVIIAVIIIICIILLTEKSFFKGVKNSGKNLYDDVQRYKDYRSKVKEMNQQQWEEYNELSIENHLKREVRRTQKIAERDAKNQAKFDKKKRRWEDKKETLRNQNAQLAMAMTEIAPNNLNNQDIQSVDNYDEPVVNTENDDNMQAQMPSNYDFDVDFKEPESLFYGPSGNLRRNSEQYDNDMISAKFKTRGLMENTKLSADDLSVLSDFREITDEYSDADYRYGNTEYHTTHPIEVNEDLSDVDGYDDEAVEEEDVDEELTFAERREAYERDFPANNSRDTFENARKGFDTDRAVVSNTPARVSTNSTSNASKSHVKKNVRYKLPPISLLNEIRTNGRKNATDELNETARKLQQTLKNFGVDVKITGSSRGPAVTRYEIEPPVGVKVSKIVSLTDDIKLSLAATDIRMEAPIPGKSAIGIEIPNKENSAVQFRELVESKTFKDAKSKISFGVGKDLGGQVVVTDIAKMPHVLIAGATGSGKSVCINTLIMSILYKATPDEVKLIMIDPKVVELSVYNDIPHLLIPVVTDPKKASAALAWAVNEMMIRYQKFAELKVRDMAGFNKKVEEDSQYADDEQYKKLPQIVIIVDELADLMMVAAKEVEESICRLAQLARAAGIHLILATQRPSVDVITGLIKANMPSRIAFSVSSGTDSRTILDTVGAERLLGKGDMLFYPQGYSKPARVQGAFVSDEEVANVVAFIRNQFDGNSYDDNAMASVERGTDSSSSSAGTGLAAPENDGLDELFYVCGHTVIEKQKASIGLLQRVHKIGFNRAARIMDQLSDAGVVSGEDGTKARTILMTIDEFEQYIKEKNHP